MAADSFDDSGASALHASPRSADGHAPTGLISALQILAVIVCGAALAVSIGLAAWW